MSALIKRPVSQVLVLLLIAAMALGACAPAAATQAPAGDPSKQNSGGRELEEVPAMEAPAPAQPAYDDSVVTESSVAQNQPGAERIVIKNGSLNIVVADPSKSMATISTMANEMGGFVVSANMYKEFISTGAEVPRASVTIRVPAERMDEAMARIKAESQEEPINENISSQDVTSEYVDLQSRLKNLEAAEAELTQIMQDANRTEDVLSVYQQLVSIREQIEVIKGQIKYYEQSAAMSAISIELIADAAVQPIEIAGWQPQGEAKQAVEALLRSLQSIGTAAIWVVVYLLPVLAVLFVIFGLPLILLFRYLRRRSQGQRQVAAAPPAGE